MSSKKDDIDKAGVFNTMGYIIYDAIIVCLGGFATPKLIFLDSL